jgi:hypothetical protein
MGNAIARHRSVLLDTAQDAVAIVALLSHAAQNRRDGTKNDHALFRRAEFFALPADGDPARLFRPHAELSDEAPGVSDDAAKSDTPNLVPTGIGNPRTNSPALIRRLPSNCTSSNNTLPDPVPTINPRFVLPSTFPGEPVLRCIGKTLCSLSRRGGSLGNETNV